VGAAGLPFAPRPATAALSVPGSPQHRTQRNAERKGALLAACLLLPAVPVALLLVLLRRELRVRRFGNGER